MPLFFLCSVLVLSCTKQPAYVFTGQAGSETVQTGGIDGELLHIAEEARRTLPVFFRHLTRPEAGEENFCIKYPFRAIEYSGIGMEQVWLTGIHFKNGEYCGILASAPLYTSGIKKGDTVVFDVEQITDWMFVQHGKIAGGRSIKYLLENIPENRRSEEQRNMLEMFE